jgi:hypothetical protein
MQELCLARNLSNHKWTQRLALPFLQQDWLLIMVHKAVTFASLWTTGLCETLSSASFVLFWEVMSGISSFLMLTS